MNISFDNPVYLWYLASLPLLLLTHFLSLYGAQRKALTFANFHTIKRINGKRHLVKNIPVIVLRLLVLGCLILSLAGATIWYTSDDTTANVVLAIDTSSSMSAEDFSPTRLGAAVRYAEKFLELQGPTAKVGVISFAGVTFIEQIPTLAHFEVTGALEELSITKSGGTDLPGAIIAGTNSLLLEEEKARIIVLFTDGSSTLGNFVSDSLEQAVDYAADKRVTIHAVGIGSTSAPIGYLPEYYNITAAYNRENLVLITNTTGGILVEAETEQELAEAYDLLVEVREKGLIPRDLDLSLLILSIIFLFFEWGLINTKFRRIT